MKRYFRIAVGAIVSLWLLSMFVLAYAPLHAWVAAHNLIPPHLVWLWPLVVEGGVILCFLYFLVRVLLNREGRR